MFAALRPTASRVVARSALAGRRTYADVADGALKLSLVLPHQVSIVQISSKIKSGFIGERSGRGETRAEETRELTSSHRKKKERSLRGRLDQDKGAEPYGRTSADD
ncbi:hypothetical protein QFC19_001581 [Naganishia cerealis]|uniref:Uncharacterized protein n=1 Tax=Naganishia cerealis TaxID=610337 RepID=A0ACC2WFD0_9TREE|nr:hypothetical protein QFC19_001581 [Naganishia cerealis]